MNLQAMQAATVTKFIHVRAGETVPLHQHIAHDEIFYCMSGVGTGLLGTKEIPLYPGDSFTANAGKQHGLIAKQDLHMFTAKIPVRKIICTCYTVNYWDIRLAMQNGARTCDDILQLTQGGGDCGGCTTRIAEIMAMACPCKQVSMQTVLDAVLAGADTVEKVTAATGAGAGCGFCNKLLQNIIDTKR